MMGLEQRAKWGWMWVVGFTLGAHNIRILYDMQGVEMQPLLGSSLTIGIGFMFAVQLITTLVYVVGGRR